MGNTQTAPFLYTPICNPFTIKVGFEFRYEQSNARKPYLETLGYVQNDYIA